MNVTSFAEIEQEFIEKVHKRVWCNATTIDTQNRPRSRTLHPIWEGSTGWVMTGRQTLKTKHLARNPYISLAYIDIADPFNPVYAECRAEWVDELAEKQRIKDLFASTPPPLGYDLGLEADNPDYGLLKLIPWRIELGSWYGETKIWLT
jgi:general stress protein 26